MRVRARHHAKHDGGHALQHPPVHVPDAPPRRPGPREGPRDGGRAVRVEAIRVEPQRSVGHPREHLAHLRPPAGRVRPGEAQAGSAVAPPIGPPRASLRAPVSLVFLVGQWIHHAPRLAPYAKVPEHAGGSGGMLLAMNPP